MERGRWTTTPARMSTGTGGAVPATGGLQEQELIGEQHEGLRPLTTDAIDPAAVTPSLGCGRRATTPTWMRTATRGTAYAPGGLQQQMSIGARQEENRTTAIVMIRPAGALPPVGRERRTTTPAWISTGTGAPALATDGLQQQELSGVHRGEGMPSATAATRFVEVPPPGGRGRRHGRVPGRGDQTPHREGSNSRRREGGYRGDVESDPFRRPSSMLGGVGKHQMIGLRGDHERGRGTVRRLPLEGASSLLCPHPSRGS